MGRSAHGRERYGRDGLIAYLLSQLAGQPAFHNGLAQVAVRGTRTRSPL